MVQCRVSLYELEPTKKVLVTDLLKNESEYLIRLHFERFTGDETVEKVKISQSCNKAIVSFKDPKSKA